MRLAGSLLLLLFPAASPFAQSSSQTAAIKKACATGVLSAVECQAKLAQLQQAGPANGEAASASGVGHWSEPHGRFTIAIAQGWQVDDSQGNLKVTKGSSWAIFETASRPGSAMDIAQAKAKEMNGMVSDWKVIGQSPFETPRHHPSAGVTAQANVPIRGGSEQRVMTFAAQSAGSGNFVAVTASSLQPQAQSDEGQVMAMFNSVRFANEK